MLSAATSGLDSLPAAARRGWDGFLPQRLRKVWRVALAYKRMLG